MVEEKFITVENIKVRYLIRGWGRPVIFIHGWLGTADNFVPVFLSFPDTYKCIAIELPGFGKSSPFTKGPHTVENYSRFINSFIQKLGLEEYYLVGDSLGGSLALKVGISAKTPPQKIIAHSPVYKPLVLTSLYKYGARLITRSSFFSKLGLGLIKKKWFQRFLSCYGDDNLRSVKLGTLRQFGLKNLVYSSPRAITESLFDILKVDLRNYRSKIKCPLLLIYGDREPIFTREYFSDFTKSFQNVSILEVSKTTHFLVLQYPKHFSKAIQEFLSRKNY